MPSIQCLRRFVGDIVRFTGAGATRRNDKKKHLDAEIEIKRCASTAEPLPCTPPNKYLQGGGWRVDSLALPGH
jgi:hypothetical protein